MYVTVKIWIKIVYIFWTFLFRQFKQGCLCSVVLEKKIWKWHKCICYCATIFHKKKGVLIHFTYLYEGGGCSLKLCRLLWWHSYYKTYFFKILIGNIKQEFFSLCLCFHSVVWYGVSMLCYAMVYVIEDWILWKYCENLSKI